MQKRKYLKKNNLQYKTENTVNKKVRDVRREISKNPFYKMFREESVVKFSHYLVVLDYSGILYVKEMNDKSIPTSYELTQQLERRRIKREKKILKQQRLELSKKKISKEKDSEITE